MAAAPVVSTLTTTTTTSVSSSSASTAVPIPSSCSSPSPVQALRSSTIVLDDEKVFREYGESIRIPKGAKHRAWNETDEVVEFIEVQTGTYFGEDDIVRISDEYNRI